MSNTIEPYSPCPCGSGKKYKFCCYLKRDQMSSAGRSRHSLASPTLYSDKELLVLLDEEKLDKGFRLLQKGLRVMHRGKYKKAIPIFRQALETAPVINSIANNLALCLLITGNLADAIQVQKESLETDILPNPFGLINLATFHYIEGDVFSSRRLLKQALNSEIPSEDSCIKVCEMLARCKRHRDILDFVSKTEWNNHPKVCFYTGIAAANLGDLKRAKKDLQRVPIRHYKAFMARRYLNHLRDNTAPHTVRGDWPYLLPLEIYPFSPNKNATDAELKTWGERAVCVEYCEALLNETMDDPLDTIKLLAGLKHPDATELLWTVAKGTFGADALRLEALNALKMKGVDLDEENEIFLEGKYEKIACQYTSLNADFIFGEPLPKKLDKLYIKAVISLQSNRPDWKFIDTTFQKIISEKPDFYPARFNHATGLIRRHRRDEGEPIIREVIEKQPEYLFARSALIQILLADDNAEAAKELIETTPAVKETHPQAMGVWVMAQALYFRHINDHENAAKSTQFAHAIAPELPMVQKLYELYHSRFTDE